MVPEVSATRWRCAVVGPAGRRCGPRARLRESSLSHWLAKDRDVRAAADPERFAAEVAESEIKRLRRRVAELGKETEDPETIHGLVGEGVDVVTKFTFVDAHRAEFSVVVLCRVVGVSTSGSYDWQTRAAAGLPRRSVARRQRRAIGVIRMLAP